MSSMNRPNKRCGVLGCTRRKRLYEFPTLPMRCGKWLRALGIKYKELLDDDHKFVCSQHFLPADFKTVGNKRQLKATAVPSIHLDLNDDDDNMSVSTISAYSDDDDDDGDRTPGITVTSDVKIELHNLSIDTDSINRKTVEQDLLKCAHCARVKGIVRERRLKAKVAREPKPTTSAKDDKNATPARKDTITLTVIPTDQLEMLKLQIADEVLDVDLKTYQIFARVVNHKQKNGGQPLLPVLPLITSSHEINQHQRRVLNHLLSMKTGEKANQPNERENTVDLARPLRVNTSGNATQSTMSTSIGGDESPGNNSLLRVRLNSTGAGAQRSTHPGPTPPRFRPILNGFSKTVQRNFKRAIQSSSTPTLVKDPTVPTTPLTVLPLDQLKTANLTKGAKVYKVDYNTYRSFAQKMQQKQKFLPNVPVESRHMVSQNELNMLDELMPNNSLGSKVYTVRKPTPTATRTIVPNRPQTIAIGGNRTPTLNSPQTPTMIPPLNAVSPASKALTTRVISPDMPNCKLLQEVSRGLPIFTTHRQGGNIVAQVTVHNGAVYWGIPRSNSKEAVESAARQALDALGVPAPLPGSPTPTRPDCNGLPTPQEATQEYPSPLPTEAPARLNKVRTKVTPTIKHLQCRKCLRHCKNIVEFEQHMLSHALYSCDHCNKIFRTAETLEQHAVTCAKERMSEEKTPEASDTLLVCNKCNVYFVEREDMLDHPCNSE